MNLIAVKKLLKNEIKKKSNLRGVHYNKTEEVIEVCDAFSLIREKAQLKNIEHDITIDINSGKLMDGVYPNTSNIIPSGEKFFIKKDGEKSLRLTMHNGILCYEFNNYFWDAKLIDNAFACIDREILKVLKTDDDELFVVEKERFSWLIYKNEISGLFILSVGLKK